MGINSMFSRLSSTYACFLFGITLMGIACKTKSEDVKASEPKYNLLDNELVFEMKNPDSTFKFTALNYSIFPAGYADQIVHQFELKDSLNNSNYRLRIMSKTHALKDSFYSTSNDKYNIYPDKLFIEFYKLGKVKENLYQSDIQQTYSFFRYTDTDSTPAQIQFKYLSKTEAPSKYAIISAKFTIIK
jgi:hypothetical protein